MAYINFRNSKLYSSREDRPGWFDNSKGWTRQNGLHEYENFKNNFKPQSNTIILLTNQYFISTRYHSGYGDSVSYDTFGRSNINAYCKNTNKTENEYIHFTGYFDYSTSYGTYGFLSQADIGYDSKYISTTTTYTININQDTLHSGKNYAYRTKFYFKKVDYDRF